MKWFKKIWLDIQNGDNIDLYVLIIASLVIASLSFFDPNLVKEQIPALTLTVLGVLAVSALNTRRIVQNVKKIPSVSNIFLDEFPDELEREMELATGLWLVGVRLSTPLKRYYSMLEHKLEQGHSINVLLIEPIPDVVQFAEMRAYARASVERTCTEISSSVDDFCKLKKISPENLSIRTIRHPLGYGFIGINPHSSFGKIYISNYPFKTKGGSLPKFILTTDDEKWYDLYKEELYNLWDAANDVDPS